MIYALFTRYMHEYALEVEDISSAVDVLLVEDEMIAEGIYNSQTEQSYDHYGQEIDKGEFKSFFNQATKI